jgi:hypothetical protein
MSGFGFTVMIEQSITVGNIIEIITIACGGVAVFFTLKQTVTNISSKVDGMQIEIKELAKIITQMAVTDIRLTNLEQDVRELRHGDGWILPPKN